MTGVAQGLAPLAEALAEGEDDAAPFVPGGDHGKQGGGGYPVAGPNAELVHDQHFGRQVHLQPRFRLCWMRGFQRSSIGSYAWTK